MVAAGARVAEFMKHACVTGRSEFAMQVTVRKRKSEPAAVQSSYPL
jgi:hypothetical protein